MARIEGRPLHTASGLREFSQRDGFTILQSLQHFVVAHDLSEVDVVAFMDRCERGRDDNPHTRPALALCGGFTTAPRSFTMATDDDLEPPFLEGALTKDPLSFMHESCIGVLGENRRLMLKTNPGRSHDISVDVIEKIVD